MGFQQGLSGLSAASTNLDVIGNNIANSSTVGFKSSTAQFADVYATSLYGVGGLQVGIGTKVGAVQQSFTQGNVSVTSNPLDIAISGEGFFRMDQGGVITYTRNGQFKLDKDGYIDNSASQRLTGYIADATGAINGGTPVDIQVSLAPSPPKSTTQGRIDFSLDSAAKVLAGAINPLDATSYNPRHTTSITVYDALGNAQSLVLYMQKSAANSWNVDGYVNGIQVDLNGAGTAGNTMTIAFNPTGGAITQINGAAAAAQSITIPGIGSAVDVLGTGASDLTFSLDLTHFTQVGGNPGQSFVNQDGYASGQLASLSVAKDGVIQGRYTNGQTRTLGQVVLNSFLNPNGLQPLGNNSWFQTADSGQPTVGAPGTGTLGSLQSGAVEESNVDMTADLVSLIVAQRTYQANAKTISAQDQILQTLVNLG